ncbi:hypothetical protein HY490_01315 [Candidatus Woesearchaeota archaeon]|nr:hypothetical protein [Candidatus Woesearchaeota archaeon]
MSLEVLLETAGAAVGGFAAGVFVGFKDARMAFFSDPDRLQRFAEVGIYRPGPSPKELGKQVSALEYRAAVVSAGYGIAVPLILAGLDGRDPSYMSMPVVAGVAYVGYRIGRRAGAWWQARKKPTDKEKALVKECLTKTRMAIIQEDEAVVEQGLVEYGVLMDRIYARTQNVDELYNFVKEVRDLRAYRDVYNRVSLALSERPAEVNVFFFREKTKAEGIVYILSGDEIHECAVGWDFSAEPSVQLKFQRSYNRDGSIDQIAQLMVPHYGKRMMAVVTAGAVDANERKDIALKVFIQCYANELDNVSDDGDEEIRVRM